MVQLESACSSSKFWRVSAILRLSLKTREGTEMAQIHEGGCLCGTVRYQAEGNPNEGMVGVCHCTFCKRRTGSAFGVYAYFDEGAVRITGGVLKTYEYRSDETNRWVKIEFCPNCGTTVTW